MSSSQPGVVGILRPSGSKASLRKQALPVAVSHFQAAHRRIEEPSEPTILLMAATPESAIRTGTSAFFHADRAGDFIWRYWRTHYPVYSWLTLREQWGNVLRFPSLRLHMFRHGETVANEGARVTGASEVALTAKGMIQAEELGQQLHGPYDLRFSSELSRARETLEVALTSAALEDWYVVDSRLNERGLGRLEGRRRVFLHEYAAGNLDYAPQGGLSYREVTRRCMSFLVDLAHAANSATDIENILISSHAGPLRVLQAIVSATADPRDLTSIELPNAQLIQLTANDIPWPAFLRDSE